MERSVTAMAPSGLDCEPRTTRAKSLTLGFRDETIQRPPLTARSIGTDHSIDQARRIGPQQYLPLNSHKPYSKPPDTKQTAIPYNPAPLILWLTV